jgi:hypothetical protein
MSTVTDKSFRVYDLPDEIKKVLGLTDITYQLQIAYNYDTAVTSKETAEQLAEHQRKMATKLRYGIRFMVVSALAELALKIQEGE